MLDLLQTITAGNAIFLAFLVVTVRRDANVLANRWLAAFLLLVGLFIIDASLLVYDIYPQYPELIGVLNLPIFALAPALYMAVSQFVAVEPKFRKKDLWHFLPFLLFSLLSLPFLFASNDIKLQELEKISGPPTLADQILLSLVVIQMIAYLIFSYLKLRKHQKNIENITASTSEVNLDWLLYFLYGTIAMVLVWFYELLFLPYQENAGWYSPVYLVAVYCLGFFALRQKAVFHFTPIDASEIEEIIAVQNDADVAHRRLIFTPEKLAEQKNKLLEKMETARPFLNSELNLPDLARQMELSVHEMSELVNEGFGENFAQFINRYRVEESKKLLSSGKYAHLNMVGIAYQAGFNSKTSFNTAFKKLTGLSPTDFKNSVEMDASIPLK